MPSNPLCDTQLGSGWAHVAIQSHVRPIRFLPPGCWTSKNPVAGLIERGDRLQVGQSEGQVRVQRNRLAGCNCLQLAYVLIHYGATLANLFRLKVNICPFETDELPAP